MSTGSPPTWNVPALEKAHGTIGRSEIVVKTIGSWTSVRGVATSVSARTSTVCGRGAESQNVAVPLAELGGRCSTPIISRNFT